MIDYTAEMPVDAAAQAMLAEHGVAIEPGQPCMAGAFMQGPPRQVTEKDARFILRVLDEWRHLQMRSPHPIAGAAVLLPDGDVVRVAHDWADGVQLGKGSVFVGRGGHVEYSGGLEDTLPYERFRRWDDPTIVRPDRHVLAGWWTFVPSIGTGAGCGVRFTSEEKPWVLVEDA